jgi:hypothetical protein
MSELRDVLERAERAVASLPVPSDGFERLTRREERRRRNNRLLACVVALMVAAGGTLGSLAILRGMHRVQPQQPGGKPSKHASVPPVALPTGRIAQRSIGGGPAQRLGPFWFGVTEGNSCLSAKPLTIGPSWTFQDGGHDCVATLGAESMRVGQARGAVHIDGDPGAPTRFNAVYGVVTPNAGRIDVVWAGGGVSSVVPVKGRFLLLWSGGVWPLRATAISADGKELATVHLAPP